MAFVPDDPAGDADVAALRQGLGWIDGRNIHMQLRWPGGDLERIPPSSPRVRHLYDKRKPDHRRSV
jgi:hypothetical protein